MARRNRSDSVAGDIAGFQGAMGEVQLPYGVELRDAEEAEIWRAFTRARAKEDWRDMDLILLVKVVQLEAEIRKTRQVLDQTGYVTENARGTLVENAHLRVLDTLQRQQLSVIRSMSLNAVDAHPRTIAGNAKKEADARKTLGTGLGVEGLLAGPVQ